MGTSKNLTTVRLLESFSPIKPIVLQEYFRISRKIDAEWGEKTCQYGGRTVFRDALILKYVILEIILL